MLGMQWAAESRSLPPLDFCSHFGDQALMTVTHALAEGTRLLCFDRAMNPLLQPQMAPVGDADWFLVLASR